MAIKNPSLSNLGRIFAFLGRQGFGDYQQKVHHQKDCDRRKQWILFKAKDTEALSRLESLDFASLSQNNTTTPGFGKADVVKLYTSLYGRKIFAFGD